jgi:hypothetical protein
MDDEAVSSSTMLCTCTTRANVVSAHEQQRLARQVDPFTRAAPPAPHHSTLPFSTTQVSNTLTSRDAHLD